MKKASHTDLITFLMGNLCFLDILLNPNPTQATFKIIVDLLCIFPLDLFLEYIRN